MVDTTSDNMVVPEVHADVSQAKFLGAVKVAGSSAVVSDDTLVGQPGETIHFPKWMALGELDDLTEAGDLVPEAMDTDDDAATIKEAGKAVKIKDRARLVGLGDPFDEAARQFGVLAARKVDADLISAAIDTATSSPLSVTSTETAASWSALVDGIALFGDEWEPEDFAGFYVNSTNHIELMRDPDFKSADKAGESALVRGAVGAIGRVPVFVTDRVAADSLTILRKRSLGLLYKKRPDVEQGRDVLGRATILATTTHYATKRLDDRGVAVVNLTAG